jgi:hypothetical protein
VAYAGTSYVLRELMPTSDSLSLQRWNGKIGRLETVLHSMGHLVAWSHMRSSGWQGAAVLDEWMDFGSNESWRQPLLETAKLYAQQVKNDWQEFSDAYQSGAFSEQRLGRGPSFPLTSRALACRARGRGCGTMSQGQELLVSCL